MIQWAILKNEAHLQRFPFDNFWVARVAPLGLWADDWVSLAIVVTKIEQGKAKNKN